MTSVSTAPPATDATAELAPKEFLRSRGALWLTATVVSTIAGALIPLIFNPRFYFYDDTAAGAYGIWYEIGMKLRSGQWPLFSDSGWAAGNYAAEGQWGLWNPGVMLLGLLASIATNAVVFTTIFKIVLLAILASGTFLTARRYGASPQWAAIAGVAVPLAGFTVYMDAASWVTGLMVFSLLPWAWWGLHRTIFSARNPAPALIASYLLITVGYVHGTLMLALLVLAVVLQCAMARQWKMLARTVVFGVIAGMIAVTVYLPGVLTAPVTVRSSGVYNTGFLSIDLTGLASSAVGSSLPQVIGWWGTFSPVPLLYIAWFLPLLALVSLEALKRIMPQLASIIAFGTVSLALTLAPSDLGPLRFPVRLTPYVVLTVVLFLAVVLSRASVKTIGWQRVVGVYTLWAIGLYLAVAQNPTIIRAHVLFGVLSAVGLGLVLLVLKRPSWPIIRRAGLSAAAVGVIGVSLATSALQHHYFTGAPLPDFHMADTVDGYKKPLEGTQGIAFVSGNPIPLGPEIWQESLLSNQWYLSDVEVQNLYSPILFAKYTHDLCMDSHGWSCDNAVDSLFTTDVATGEPLVDLLSIDTVQILKPKTPTPSTVLSSRHVPAGWTEIHRNDLSVVWIRDKPLKNTGGPVWTSGGLEVSTTSNSSQDLVLHVSPSSNDGGTVVLSRLAWPGYKVAGASLSDPTRGYLVTLSIPAGSAGTDVHVTFEPPAWKILVIIIYLAIGLGLAWSVVEALQPLYVSRRKGIRGRS